MIHKSHSSTPSPSEKRNRTFLYHPLRILFMSIKAYKLLFQLCTQRYGRAKRFLYKIAGPRKFPSRRLCRLDRFLSSHNLKQKHINLKTSPIGLRMHPPFIQQGMPPHINKFVISCNSTPHQVFRMIFCFKIFHTDKFEGDNNSLKLNKYTKKTDLCKNRC